MKCECCRQELFDTGERNVMLMLSVTQPLTITQLAVHIGFSPSAISKTVNKLLYRKYLVVIPNEYAKNVKMVSIAPKYNWLRRRMQRK